MRNPAGPCPLRGRARPVLVGWLSALLAGCISLHPVESTPEGILASIEPGDTVRMATRDRGELVMRVRVVTDSELHGRVERGRERRARAQQNLIDNLEDPGAIERVRFDRIETIQVERASAKKAMLTTLVPAVIAAIVICNSRDCETRSVVTAQ